MLKIFKLNNTSLASLTLGVGCALALSACDQGMNQPENEIGAVETEQGQNVAGEDQALQEGDEQVLGQSVSPVEEQQNIGTTQYSADEAEVQARQRVLRSQIVQYEIPTVSVCQEFANINEMNLEHFAALGVPRDVAQNIINRRNQNGRFASLSELRQVQGMNDQIFSNLQQQTAVNQSAVAE